ncbi:MAG: endonuclease V, partial [Actinocrinis sp.]
DRKVVGVARRWHPNGVLSEEDHFDDGELVEVRKWDENGNYIVEPPVTRGFDIPEDPKKIDLRQRALLDWARRTGEIPSPLHHIAAVALRYEDADTLAASAVIFDAASLTQVESSATRHALKDAHAETMNFEEVLAAIEALRGLTIPAGLIVCPGNGPNHTTEFNFATHLGIVTGKPTFGVSDDPYLGTYTEPGQERGAWTDLVDDRDTIGRTLRTQTGENPVFITYGQRLDLNEAADLTLRLTEQTRLPVASTAAEAALNPAPDAASDA